MFYFVKDVIKLGFTQSLNLNLDKRHVGQYTRQCAFIQFYNLFTRQCILSTVSARDTFSPRRGTYHQPPVNPRQRVSIGYRLEFFL